MTMSRKSQIPPHLPLHAPRWIGSAESFAVADKNSGFSSRAFSETTTCWFHGRLGFEEGGVAFRSCLTGSVVLGKVMAMRPSSPALITGKLTSLTPGGATIIGVSHVRPWSREIDRNGSRFALSHHTK